MTCHVISQSAVTRRESNFCGNNVSFAEINFREEKIFKYVQMALPKKKNLVFFFYLYLTATTNKEFTSSLTSFCGESSEKKIRLEHHISQLKSALKAKITQTNSQVSEGGNYSQTRSRFHSWIDYLKSEPVCRFCNL